MTLLRQLWEVVRAIPDFIAERLASWANEVENAERRRKQNR